MNRNRVDAFKSAILNTVVRVLRPAFEGLTLSNCLQSADFRAHAREALRMPLLARPVEDAHAEARLELLHELRG